MRSSTAVRGWYLMRLPVATVPPTIRAMIEVQRHQLTLSPPRTGSCRRLGWSAKLAATARRPAERLRIASLVSLIDCLDRCEREKDGDGGPLKVFMGFKPPAASSPLRKDHAHDVGCALGLHLCFAIIPSYWVGIKMSVSLNAFSLVLHRRECLF